MQLFRLCFFDVIRSKVHLNPSIDFEERKKALPLLASLHLKTWKLMGRKEKNRKTFSFPRMFWNEENSREESSNENRLEKTTKCRFYFPL